MAKIKKSEKSEKINKSNKSNKSRNKKENNNIKSSQAWASKYRPRKLDDVVGQDNAVNQIKGMIERKQLASAILLSGPSGAGKTTLARILAHTVNEVDLDKNDPNLNEVNISDERGIDKVREYSNYLKFKPQNGNIRFLLLDEIHSATHQGKSALLKPLEEPPSHACIILCTDQPEKLFETIRNRCQKIHVNMPEPKALVPMLDRICKKENVSFGKNHQDILKRVAENARGVPRESIQVLEALTNTLAASKSDADNKNISEKHIQKALSTVVDVDAEMVALKTLLAIYSGKPDVCIRTVGDTSDYRGLMYRLFDLNSYLVYRLSNAETFDTIVRRKLVNQLEKRDKLPDLKTALLVHQTLMDLQTRMGTYLVGEPHLLVSYLGDQALKLGSKKK